MRPRTLFCMCMMAILSVLSFGLRADEPMLTVAEVAVLPYGTPVYGISTLDPSGPRKFTGRLLGVMSNTVGPGHSWYAVKLDEESIPVVAAGQSGSPMFIERDDVSYKIGTLSFGDGWQKSPLCYLTPIHELLNATTSPSAQPAPPMLPSPQATSLLSIARSVLPDGDSLVRMLDGPVTSGVVTPGQALPVVPGGVLGVQLAWGDFDITAFGTVSHMNGQSVYMFGHPFLQLGPTEYRLVPAKVLTVVQRYPGSHILAVPIAGAAPVGVITQDRETGISGTLGVEPTTAIPVEISMTTSKGEQKMFRFSSISDPTFAPRIIGIGITTALQAYSREVGDMTVFLSGKMEVDGVGDIEFSDSFSSITGGGPFSASPFSLVRDKTGSVLSNRFSRAKIKRISIQAKVFDEYRKLDVESATLERTNYNPGETMKLRIALTQPLKESKSVALEIPLPADLQFGVGKIVVGSADIINGAESGGGSVVNLASLVASLTEKRRPDALYVYVVLPPSRIAPATPPVPIALQVGDIAGQVLRTSKRLSSNVEEYEIGVSDFQVSGKQEVEFKIGASGIKPPGHP